MKESSTCPNDSGWLLSYLQTSDQAIPMLESSSNHKRHPVIQLRLGEHYLQQGHGQEALAAWTDVSNIDLYFANRSIHWAKLGFLDKALAMVDIVEQINDQPDPDKQLLYETLCHVSQAQDSMSNSLRWCELDAEVSPNAWTLLTLADVQIGLRYYDDALATLEQILRQPTDKHDFGRAYQKKAEIYKYRGQVQEAAVAYQIALEYEISNKWLYMGFAQTLLELGEISQACLYFEQAQSAGYQPSAIQAEQFAQCHMN